MDTEKRLVVYDRGQGRALLGQTVQKLHLLVEIPIGSSIKPSLCHPPLLLALKAKACIDACIIPLLSCYTLDLAASNR
jgi:hypothetical protein